MKKVKTKLLIMMFGIIIVTFLIFLGAYFYLSTNFIRRQAGNTFVNMANVVSTEVNSEVTSDFLLFKADTDELLNDMGGEVTNTSIGLVANKESYFEDLKYLRNYKVGFIIEGESEDAASDYVIDGEHYLVDIENNKQINYLNDIAIYKFSNLLVDNTDSTAYFFLRYKNVILYVDAAEYFTPLLKNVTDMPTNKYFIMENDANILIYEGSNLTNKKIYSVLKQDTNFNYKMSIVREDLLEKRSGYGLFDIDDVSSFLVYSPVFSELLEKPLFIGYTLRYTDAVENSEYRTSINYLRYVSIVVFSAVLIILSITLYVAARRYTKREQDFTLSKVNQFFIKPYAMTINRHGDILKKNKTFITEVENSRQYHNVNDLKIYNMEEIDVLSYVKGQKTFIIKFEGKGDKVEYVRFISVKTGNRYTAIGENCTKEVEENEKNMRVAMYNSVTSLPNRLVFDRDVNELCASGKLYVSNNSVIALDIIDFNKINRLFGYSAADNMLKEISTRFGELLADYNATIYNIRTSLFIAVVRDLENYGLLLSWIKTAISKLEDPIEIKRGYFTSIEVRMGLFNIEASQMEAVDSRHIYECVMTALDRSKNTRLTKFSVYSSDYGKSLSRDQIMEQDLAEAIKNKEFIMYFQAQFNTKIKRIVGFEALIRWDNPKYRLDSPEHFITIAEKNGMITEIGRFVIEQTFDFAKRIEKTGIHISMNVSPVQLLQSGFVNELIESFKEHDLKPGSIAVEITETFLMENSDVVISKLKLLRDAGFSVHLDDFGVGYSSMLYLKDLPVDTIKIDKEFTKHMINDKYSRVIVTKVVQIAVNLGLNVIAEGVETERQADLLLKAGCRIIQGYLISKAIPENDAIELIKKYLGDVDIDSSDVSMLDNEIEIDEEDLALLSDDEDDKKKKGSKK